MTEPAPSLVIDCRAWGAHQYHQEAELLAAQAELAGDQGERHVLLRRAEACRTACRNALAQAGLPDDVPPVPWRHVPLTDEQLEQRARDHADAVDQAVTALRSRRDALLAASDWTQLPGAPIGPEEKTVWDQYRQQLRDLPAETADPFNPAWPAAPGGDGAAS